MNILTKVALMAEATKFKGFCPVCYRYNQWITVAWRAGYCNGCGNYFSPETLNETVKKRRKLLGLSKAEMAMKMGLSIRTISNYEKDWPSKKYWRETRKLVEEHYEKRTIE